MLMEFGAYNYTSFKEGFSVNLRLNAGTPKDISKDKNHVALLAIKGANASGKTNVLKAVSFLCHFAQSSFEYKTDEAIPIDGYFSNKDDSSFYAIFELDGKEYSYELIANKNEVIQETLSIDEKIIVTRKNNSLIGLKGIYKELESIKKLRNNVSIISMAHQYELECIESFYNLVSNAFSNVAYDGLNQEIINKDKVSEHYFKNKKALEFTADILRKADTGIENIIVVDKEDEETRDVKYFPLFTYIINNEETPLLYQKQSSGVKVLYKYLAVYQEILDSGGLLILDELDINLHPDLLESLLKLFENPEINTLNAQLIFTTHNEKVIDYLKKYRLIFVNKDDNESYLYRLDEAGEVIRNDRSIMPLYDSKSLGGRPNMEF